MISRDLIKKIFPKRFLKLLRRLQTYILPGCPDKLSPIFNLNSRIIYSGEGEDVILHNMFLGRERGFYVDVGAHHPKRYSNTYLFYKRGWRGINIDAAPGSMRSFSKVRPGDINLEVGCAKYAGLKEFIVYDEPLVSTFSNDLVQERTTRNTSWHILDRVMVDVMPLSEILDRHLPQKQKIDFMSIDVEGLDLEVLESNDWSRYRPLYVLVEILEQGDGLHDGNFFSLSELEKSQISLFMKKNNYILYLRSGNMFFFRDVSGN